MNNPNYEINYSNDPYDKNVEFVFLNTCWFISSWREEMINTMNNLFKKSKKVYLLWCWLQYFKTLSNKLIPPWFILRNEGQRGSWGGFEKGKKLSKDLFFLSRNDFENITIANLIKWYNSKDFRDFQFTQSPRAYTNAEFWFEYLKIAEWCDNHCTFCIIPKLRWKQKSLPIDKILIEIHNMINSGIQEIILIAQDTTTYWRDLYGESKLFELLENIEKINVSLPDGSQDFKYRLLYLYPDIITIQQLKKLKKFKKFIPYFDIPLQHISSPILKRMWRFYDEQKIYQLLDFIKKEFPVSFIRTNFIVWFPGETDQDHDKLLKFINLKYFDNISLFEYHNEPFATSSKLDNKVPDNIIRKRFTQTKQLVNHQLLDREDNRKWKEYIWYIMDIYPTLDPSPLHGEGNRIPTIYTVGKNKLPSWNFMIELARNLRKNQTKAELFLREILRNKKINNIKFRRQHPIWNYIADFYCSEKKLIIEIDWSIHNIKDQKEYDKKRDIIMKKHNLNVIRFTNDDVFNKTQEVIQTIIDISNRSPLSTQWRGAGGEVTVRPRLHAPEIDPYDEVKLNQIISKFWNDNQLQIWDLIKYKIF